MQHRVTCVHSYYEMKSVTIAQRVFRRQFTVGRHGHVPSRNTIPDFFLWGFLKDRVFRRHIRTIQELKQAIVEEVAAIDEDLRRHVYGNFQTRLQQCFDVNGGHLPDVICRK
jgi:hypothetical protein